MSRWRVLAPAKLTWSLQIGDRRDDGYHDLVAEMLTVDLADELVIDDEQVGLSVEGTAYSRAELLGAGEENLVIRALALAGRSAGGLYRGQPAALHDQLAACISPPTGPLKCARLG